jgi:hypothetical protein
MQHCFYLLFNIVLGGMLFYTFYDAEKDYVSASSVVTCMNDDGLSKKFCAQCVLRNDEMPPQKGFIV